MACAPPLSHPDPRGQRRAPMAVQTDSIKTRVAGGAHAPRTPPRRRSANRHPRRLPPTTSGSCVRARGRGGRLQSELPQCKVSVLHRESGATHESVPSLPQRITQRPGPPTPRPPLGPSATMNCGCVRDQHAASRNAQPTHDANQRSARDEGARGEGGMDAHEATTRRSGPGCPTGRLCAFAVEAAVAHGCGGGG